MPTSPWNWLVSFFYYDIAAAQKAIRDDTSTDLAVAQQDTDTSLAALATELAAAISAECAGALARTDIGAGDLNGHTQPSPKLDKVLGELAVANRAENFVKCGELNKEQKRLPALIGEREIPVPLAALPPVASSSTPGSAREALAVRLATLHVSRTSAQYEGTLLKNNIKFVEAGAPVKDATAKENWDLAAARNSELRYGLPWTRLHLPGIKPRRDLLL